MNSGKHLIVHAGGTKTGSTAIQNFCERHAADLLKHGYSYQNTTGITHSHQFTHGNGKSLFDALQTTTLPEAELDRIVSGYFGPCEHAICSSEYFENLWSDGWKKLWQSADRLNITITVVYFIRSAVPFLLSAYDQAIKHHGESGTLEEWSSQPVIRWNHVDALRRMESQSERLNLKVLSYDLLRKSLLDNFFAAIGCSLKPSDYKSEKGPQVVNRSLTTIEREILLEVNKSLGFIYSAEITDLLTQSAPDISTQPSAYSQSWLEDISRQYSEDVAWINERFGRGERLVDILPITAGHPVRPLEPCQQTKQEVAEKVLQWALDKLKSMQHETQQKLIVRLHNTIANGMDVVYPDQPEDFNPLAYLILNPDVLFAEIDPAEHYYCSGRKEGRNYSFDSIDLTNYLLRLKFIEHPVQTIVPILQQLNKRFHDVCRGTTSACQTPNAPPLELPDSPSRVSSCADTLTPLPASPDIHAGTRIGHTLNVVLGMHRSGTSAVTRALCVFDIQLGDRLMQAMPDNEKGFWEDLDLNSLNMEILDAIGSGWDHTQPIPSEVFERLTRSAYFARAVSLLCNKTENTRQFGIKDPRLPQLLPFWKAVFAHCGFSVRYIITLRNPLSVCHSLETRDGFDHGKSYTLWAGHLLSSLCNTGGENRLLIDYDLLMDKPEEQLARLSSVFNITAIPDSAEEFTRSFLEKKLRHSSASFDDLIADPLVFPIVAEMYQELLKVAADEILLDSTELSARIEQWQREYEYLKPLFGTIDRMSAQNALLRRQVQEQKAYTAQLAQERNDLDISFLDMTEKLTERDKQLKSVRSLLAERENHIYDITQKLVLSAERLSTLEHTAMEHAQRLAETAVALADKERQIGEYSAAAATFNQQVSEARQQADRYERRAATLSEFVEKSSRQMDDLQRAYESLEQLHSDCLAELKENSLMVKEYRKRHAELLVELHQARSYATLLSERHQKLLRDVQEGTFIRKFVDAFRDRPEW